jgi:hypothetical protein
MEPSVQDRKRPGKPQEPKAQPARVEPPGPLARRRRARKRRVRALEGARSAAAAAPRAFHALSGRRRAIVLGVLTAGAVYLVVALSSEGDRGDSAPFPPSGADVPLTTSPGGDAAVAPDPAPAAEAEPAPPAEPAPAPEARRVGDGTFTVALPPGWRRLPGPPQGLRFEPPGGRAAVVVLSGPRDTLSGLARQGAAFMSERLPPGGGVSYLPAERGREPVAVARAEGGGETRTAYVARAPDRGFVLVSGHADGAPAAARRQAQRVVRSFRPGA